MRYQYLLLVALLVVAFLPGAVLATDVDVTATPYVEWPTVNSTAATAITDISALLHGGIADIGSSNATARGFQWGYATGNYTNNWTDEGNFGVCTFEHTISGLDTDIEVFWRAFAINPSGTGYSPERSFYTIGLPAAPTNFTITQVGGGTITLNWTKGENAETTLIIANESGYPDSREDGYIVYSSNGTSVTLSGLSFDTATYCYRAWSHNDYGYSADYADASIGNPLSAASIIFVIALCGFGLWKKGYIRVLLAICIMIWAAFAAQYDIKIAAPLLVIGVWLFVVDIIKLWQGYRGRESIIQDEVLTPSKKSKEVIY